MAEPNAKEEASKGGENNKQTRSESEEPARTELIEGGLVDLEEKPPRFEESKHRARTASSLAYILVGALVVTLVLHYIVVGLLGHSGDKDTADLLSQVFDKWLPIISGLVGGAVTYYFTKEAR